VNPFFSPTTPPSLFPPAVAPRIALYCRHPRFLFLYGVRPSSLIAVRYQKVRFASSRGSFLRYRPAPSSRSPLSSGLRCASLCRFLFRTKRTTLFPFPLFPFRLGRKKPARACNDLLSIPRNNLLPFFSDFQGHHCFSPFFRPFSFSAGPDVLFHFHGPPFLTEGGDRPSHLFLSFTAIGLRSFVLESWIRCRDQFSFVLLRENTFFFRRRIRSEFFLCSFVPPMEVDHRRLLRKP